MCIKVISKQGFTDGGRAQLGALIRDSGLPGLFFARNLPRGYLKGANGFDAVLCIPQFSLLGAWTCFCSKLPKLGGQVGASGSAVDLTIQPGKQMATANFD